MKREYIRRVILKRKKLIIVLGVLVVLAGGVTFIRYNSLKEVNLNSDLLYQEETVFLQKGEINNSIIVSGMVKSAEISNVSTAINAKVKSINVKVGDMVKVGDIICILDSSDIEKEIENKTKTIEEERKGLQENYNRLLEKLESLKNNKNSSNSYEINSALNKLNTAKSELNNYEPTFNNVKKTYNTMISGIKSKQNNYVNAENNKVKYYEEWIKSGGRTDSEEYKKYIDANDKLEKARDELNKAKELYEYDNITNKYKESLEIYNGKVLAVEEATIEYNRVSEEKMSLDEANNQEIEELESNINNISQQISKLDDNEELKLLKESLNKTVLKAETNGKITELKVNAGDLVEGVIATIQSTDNLILQVNIPEYDIEKVKSGMKVKITSNTLTDEVDGEIKTISPVAGSSENPGFLSDITIKNASGLFIGTTAKAEVIISSKENVIIAPIDAIQNIEENPVVLLKDENGEFKEVPVQLGERNDYYIEISGEGIEEGLEIKNNLESDYYTDF